MANAAEIYNWYSAELRSRQIRYAKIAKALINQEESGIIKEEEKYVGKKGFIIHQGNIHIFLLKPSAKHDDKTSIIVKVIFGSDVETFSVSTALGVDEKNTSAIFIKWAPLILHHA